MALGPESFWVHPPRSGCLSALVRWCGNFPIATDAADEIASNCYLI
jgi:hypothetical protein